MLSRLRIGAVVVVFAAVAATMFYPLVFVLATAVRTDADYVNAPTGFPRHFTLDNITRAWDDAGAYVFNSVIVVVAAVLLVCALSSLAGFALAKLQVPLGRAVLAIVVMCMIVPPVALMIPIFKLVQDLHLLNMRTGLILVYVGLNLPFSVFLMTTFMKAMPAELIEASRIDGAGTMRTFWSVALPLFKPALATLATLNFLVLWNELLFSLIILQQEAERTLTVGIATQQPQYIISIPTIAAGLLFSAIPPLLIFILFQRNLVQGLTAGAVK